MAYKHLFSKESHSALYHNVRPTYPSAVYDYFISYLRQRLAPPHALAVDVGCGTGTSTRPLADYFDHVIGCDVSAAMIAQAQKIPNENISYSVTNFDKIPAKDGGVQMVMSSLAAHWFEPIEDFYREVDRVLCPGGILVVCCYNVPHFDTAHKHHAELNALTKDFQEVELKDYLTPKNIEILHGYKNFHLPYKEQIRNDDFDITWVTNLRDVATYFRTWSMVQLFYEKNPEEPDPVINFTERLQKYLEKGPPEQCQTFIRFPVHIVMGRKP